METRDEIYEDIMEKAWSPNLGIFTQSYEAKKALDKAEVSNDAEKLDAAKAKALDAAVLIMPLVSFISATDERFLSTIKEIMKPIKQG